MKKFKNGIAATLAVAMAVAAFGTHVYASQTKPSAQVKSVSFQKPDTTTLVLKKDASYQLKTKVEASGKAGKKVSYQSSNPKVVKVSAKGKLTAKKNGTAKVTAISATDASKKAVLTVKVGTPVTKVELDAAHFEGKQGTSFRLKAQVAPKNATVKKVAYQSSDTDVAKVSSKGKVSLLRAGTAKIMAAAQDGSGKSAVCEVTVVETGETATDLDYSGYTLKWEDQFNGDSLNRDDWNVELHEPGWVNSELQEYVDSKENIYIKDGKLVLKPVKTVDDKGNASYTSGRVNTQNKHDFKYGLFEAKVKVPKGQGFLPAFWMMPTNENLYGQWPRCGEIDIMEVMGQTTDTCHGTIHYGNPHSQSQGTYTLDNGSFSEDYHLFSAEWEPGKISWYVDGKRIHTENDWYSATEGQGEITYPAPFDQPFYMILNLAVGGSWVGYPDETTDIENAAFQIDYVKAYQKDSYDENVEKPVQQVDLREPDANGNYVNNGDFANAEDLTDDKDWAFLTALGGEASAQIKDKEISIVTANEGTVDYSVQLVQPNLPLKKGGVYKVSFDAYADEARMMKAGVSAPDRGYKRYLADTNVELTSSKQTFSYEFTMTDVDDANARLEYNLGAAGSKAGVHISNVSLVKVGQKDLENGEKSVLTDGNYVYNGSFQEGKNRLGYWDITKPQGAKAAVTNTDNIRRLKVEAPAGTSEENPVLVSQKGLALSDGGQYALSFSAQGEKGKRVKAVAAGKAFDASLASEGEESFSYKFTADAGAADKSIVFRFEAPGTYYLDNVRLVEDTLIKNGSFKAGFAGYEPFVDGSADAEYVVDSLTEDHAADFSIRNTGDAAWKIQLKQNLVELEKGQHYRLSMDAKSDIDRKIMFAIQRDGSKHNDDWTPYTEEKVIELSKDYKTYEIEFEMTEDSDPEAVLSVSMGAVEGTQISEKHRVCIDNIKLEKIDGK